MGANKYGTPAATNLPSIELIECLARGQQPATHRAVPVLMASGETATVNPKSLRSMWYSGKLDNGYGVPPKR